MAKLNPARETSLMNMRSGISAVCSMTAMVLAMALEGCADVSKPQMQAGGERKGKQNLNLLHLGDPNLAGVIIRQNDPVGMDGAPARKSSDHPRWVAYYFWDLVNEHHVEYDKSGRIVSEGWYKTYKPSAYLNWMRVDFSYGSDPKFRRHRDPRNDTD